MFDHFFDVLKPYLTLDENAKNLIMSKCHIEKLRKGELYIESGKISRKAGFVLSGALRYFFVDKFGKEVTTMFIKKHEFVVRLNSFFDKIPSDRSVDAEVNTSILTMTRENYFDIVEIVPEFTLALGQIATNFLTRESERQRLYIDHVGAERYKLFLGHFPTISKKIALRHVASFLGMSAPTLSRIRKKMKT